MIYLTIEQIIELHKRLIQRFKLFSNTDSRKEKE
jgi:hypothetical protein